MGALALRPVARRWRGLPARSARLRLTLTFSVMFLALGTAVIAVFFVLVRTTVHSSSTGVVASPHGAVQLITTGVAPPQTPRLLAVSWLALAFTAIASLPLGWFAAGRVLRPLRQMTASARTISAGNLHQRLAVTGPEDEFKQLGDTVDDLLARLEAAFAAQRRFVANAAHELRTPLTLERTLLQVALADPSATEATLRATCEELLASGRSQERLLEGLLTLATGERGLDERQAFDLASLADGALGNLRAQTERAGLNVTARLAPARVVGDAALAERLVSNLLDNAVRYNHPGGWIEIETAGGSGPVMLRVANTGPPIAPAAVGRLFEPFQRLGSERVAADGHYGLGLSIARAIAGAHDATISAEPRPGGGLTVLVRFPATDLAAPTLVS